MNDRISLLLKEENLTAGKFADILGVQPSGISHLISGRNKPNFDFIAKVLTCFPAVNPDWLILGKGEMYRQTAGEQTFSESSESFFLETEPPIPFSSDALPLETPAIPLPSLPKELSLPADDEKPAEKKPEKQIDKIVFFYSDRTFSVYTETEFI